MISGLIERERCLCSQTREHFFVTDLAAKYRQLVCTESLTPQNQFTGRVLCQELPGAKIAFNRV